MYTEKDAIKVLKKIGVELPDDITEAKLIEDGLMDSLQIMQLFLELEGVLGTTIDQEEINPDNLEDVASIVLMMNRLA